MARVQANGIEIEYESFGNPEDPAVLLIMGFSAPLVMWPESFCKALAARGFRVVRFDNRDIGLSSHLSHLGHPDVMAAVTTAMSGGTVSGAPYLLADMAADAVGLLDALGIEKAHVAGASMGGMIAQIIATEHPGRVLSLVSIMSTTGEPGLPQAEPEAQMALLTPPASPSREDRIKQGKAMWAAIGSPGFPATPEELDAIVTRAIDRAEYDPAGIARQLVAILASPPRHETLKSVRCPALVLHGKDDPLVKVEAGEATARAIPGAKLVVVPGMGHDFSEALMAVFDREIGGFLSSLKAA